MTTCPIPQSKEGPTLMGDMCFESDTLDLVPPSLVNGYFMFFFCFFFLGKEDIHVLGWWSSSYFFDVFPYLKWEDEMVSWGRSKLKSSVFP